MRWNDKLHPSTFPLDFGQTVEQAARTGLSVPLEREFRTREAAQDYAEKFRLWRACLRAYSGRSRIRCVDLEQSHRIVATIHPIHEPPDGYSIWVSAHPRLAATAALALGIDATAD
jgi:hypothetical protein